MQKKLIIKLLPSEAADPLTVKQMIASSCAVDLSSITGYNIVKQSIDARGRQVWFQLTLNVFIDEPWQETALLPLSLQDVHHASKKVIVIGAGPASFAMAYNPSSWKEEKM